MRDVNPWSHTGSYGLLRNMADNPEKLAIEAAKEAAKEAGFDYRTKQMEAAKALAKLASSCQETLLTGPTGVGKSLVLLLTLLILGGQYRLMAVLLVLPGPTVRNQWADLLRSMNFVGRRGRRSVTWVHQGLRVTLVTRQALVLEGPSATRAVSAVCGHGPTTVHKFVVIDESHLDTVKPVRKTTRIVNGLVKSVTSAPNGHVVYVSATPDQARVEEVPKLVMQGTVRQVQVQVHVTGAPGSWYRLLCSSDVRIHCRRPNGRRIRNGILLPHDLMNELALNSTLIDTVQNLVSKRRDNALAAKQGGVCALITSSPWSAVVTATALETGNTHPNQATTYIGGPTVCDGPYRRAQRRDAGHIDACARNAPKVRHLLYMCAFAPTTPQTHPVQQVRRTALSLVYVVTTIVRMITPLFKVLCVDRSAVPVGTDMNAGSTIIVGVPNTMAKLYQLVGRFRGSTHVDLILRTTAELRRLLRATERFTSPLLDATAFNDRVRDAATNALDDNTPDA